MRLATLQTFFPVPFSLMSRAVGLDISDRSIKFVELVPNQERYSLLKSGEVDIPAGVLECGKIKNKEALVTILKKLKEENDFNYVYASLPEELAYVVRMRVPNMPKKEIRGSIELQLEGYVPLPPEGVVFDYEIFHEPTPEKDFFDLAVSIFPKQLAQDYTDVLRQADLVPLALEIEAQSVARSLVSAQDPGTYMIVDIGKVRTGFSIVCQHQVIFTSTTNGVGGQDITALIQKNLALSYDEAERVKIEKGMMRSADNVKLFETLVPIASILRDEMSRHYFYWQEHRENREFGADISKIIFCGGQCTLPGLTEYVAANLRTPVEIGNPWVNIFDIKTDVPPIDRNNSLRFGTAIGLALRNYLRN